MTEDVWVMLTLLIAIVIMVVSVGICNANAVRQEKDCIINSTTPDQIESCRYLG